MFFFDDWHKHQPIFCETFWTGQGWYLENFRTAQGLKSDCHENISPAVVKTSCCYMFCQYRIIPTFQNMYCTKKNRKVKSYEILLRQWYVTFLSFGGFAIHWSLAHAPYCWCHAHLGELHYRATAHCDGQCFDDRFSYRDPYRDPSWPIMTHHDPSWPISKAPMILDW